MELIHHRINYLHYLIINLRYSYALMIFDPLLQFKFVLRPTNLSETNKNVTWGTKFTNTNERLRSPVFFN